MIKIQSRLRKNPQDVNLPTKHYIEAVSNGTTDLERLAYLVANQSTVSEGDCYAVIITLLHNISDELSQGKIVKLDRLGSFQISLSSTGVANSKDISSSLITKARINFRPDKRLRSLLNNLEFTF